MKKQKQKKTGTLVDYVRAPRASIFEHIKWPSEVWILRPKDVSTEISAPADKPQTIWGHINNELRYQLHISMYDAQLIIATWHRHFTFVGHIFKSDPKFKRALKILDDYQRASMLYNSAWCTLGYIYDQEELAIEVALASLPGLIKHSPATVPYPHPLKKPNA